MSSIAPHIVMQLLLKEAGVDFRMDYVHFRGTGEVMASMLRRETEAMLVTTTGGNRYVQREPDLKWLVTLGHTRSPVARDVPTLIEQRVPNAERIADSMAYTRRSFVAPPRMPEELRSLLAKAFQLAMTHKDLHVRAVRADLPIDYERGEVPQRAVVKQIEVMRKFAPVLKEKLGIK